MLILFKFSTGDGWSSFMFEAAQTDDCLWDQTYDDLALNGPQGCGSSLSYPFFISFQVVVSMLILNLTVAAVIDGLQAATAEDNRLIKQSDIDHLVETWSKFDSTGSKKLTMN